MANEQQEEELGSDLLTVAQVAARLKVHRTTVLRWIDKGLQAFPASQEQLGQLVAKRLLERIPPHQVYLVPATALATIDSLRHYPQNTRRPRRNKTTGACHPAGR